MKLPGALSCLEFSSAGVARLIPNEQNLLRRKWLCCLDDADPESMITWLWLLFLLWLQLCIINLIGIPSRFD